MIEILMKEKQLVVGEFSASGVKREGVRSRAVK